MLHLLYMHTVLAYSIAQQSKKYTQTTIVFQGISLILKNKKKTYPIVLLL